MADKELDKNQQEKDIDIDALFAKMMADKAASGEEIRQAEEEPVETEATETEEAPADMAEAEEQPLQKSAGDTETEETEPAETAEDTEAAEAEEPEAEEQPVPEADVVTGDAEKSADTAEEVSAEENDQEEEYVPAADVGTKKRFFSFSRRMLFLALVPMLAICIMITLFSTKSLRSGLEAEIEKSLQIVATSLDET